MTSEEDPFPERRMRVKQLPVCFWAHQHHTSVKQAAPNEKVTQVLHFLRNVLRIRFHPEGVAPLCYPSGGKAKGVAFKPVWLGKGVDGVSSPSGRPTMARWRKLARSGG